MSCTRYLIALAVISILTSAAWSVDPVAPAGFYCQALDPLPVDDNLEGVLTGSTKILWIVCAPDSHALLPIQHWTTDRDSCDVRPSRVMFPSTYRMPWWKASMLDSADERSFTRYFIDQSHGKWRPYGLVSGFTDSTIWVCDPDSQYRPTPPYTTTAADPSNPWSRCYGNSGGTKFFLNIIHKVDDSVNFGQFDLNNDGRVDKIIFDIYGLAEQVEENWRFQGTGGVAALALDANTLVATNDTNAHGDTVRIGYEDGVTIWTPSVEAYQLSDPAWTQSYARQETYWQTHNMAAHELGHQLGFDHTDRGYSTGFGCFETMGTQGPFREQQVNPDLGIRLLGPTSPYNPYYRQQKGWIDTVVVERPLLGWSLGDNLSTGKMLVVPTELQANPQHFLVYASMRERIWEVNYFTRRHVRHMPRSHGPVVLVCDHCLHVIMWACCQTAASEAPVPGRPESARACGLLTQNSASTRFMPLGTRPCSDDSAFSFLISSFSF
jgi:hypothetical protein